jgi:NAD(P)-dependent dehydrogenase (short-subunit alcohol dehydrogenase family)
MSVVVAYAGRKAPAEEVVTAIIEAGGMATSFQADVAEESDVAALFDAAELSYGGVDVVVNAAGVMLLSPLVDLDLEVFDRMVRINLRGTFVIGREATLAPRADYGARRSAWDPAGGGGRPGSGAIPSFAALRFIVLGHLRPQSYKVR